MQAFLIGAGRFIKPPAASAGGQWPMHVSSFHYTGDPSPRTSALGISAPSVALINIHPPSPWQIGVRQLPYLRSCQQAPPDTLLPPTHGHAMPGIRQLQLGALRMENPRPARVSVLRPQWDSNQLHLNINSLQTNETWRNIKSRSERGFYRSCVPNRPRTKMS